MRRCEMHPIFSKCRKRDSNFYCIFSDWYIPGFQVAFGANDTVFAKFLTRF